MACSSCGKNASTRVGTSPNTAIVYGEPTRDVVRIRVLLDGAGLQVGAVKYVRGDGVEALIEAGIIAPLTGGRMSLPTSGGFTLYYVGGVGYPSIDAARMRSGQTGEEIVVRTFGG